MNWLIFYVHSVLRNIIIVFHLILCKKSTFLRKHFSYHIASICFGRASCHTWGLPASSMLIAVTTALLPSVDGLWRVKNARASMKSIAPIINYFKYVCMYVYTYIVPQNSIMPHVIYNCHIVLCFGNIVMLTFFNGSTGNYEKHNFLCNQWWYFPQNDIFVSV